MISASSPQVAHPAATPAYGTFGDRHGGRSYRAHSRAGVRAGRILFFDQHKIPLSPPGEKGEKTDSSPPFVKGGRGDFHCVTELLRNQQRLVFEFFCRDLKVLCACFAVNRSKNNKDQRQRAKQAAVSALVRSVSATEHEFLGQRPAIVPNIEIVADSLGKPHLSIDGSGGPAVSFAYERDTMWVAVGPEGSSVGIDAAASDSFSGNYPFHRVFHDRELEFGGEKEEVAALVWSAKEAVVKALGCGFHLVDPLHVDVELCYVDHEGLLLKARLADSARQRLRLQTANLIIVRTLRYKQIWVSVAALG